MELFLGESGSGEGNGVLSGRVAGWRLFLGGGWSFEMEVI